MSVSGNFKHGAILQGFMPCDRCISNGKCRRFEAGGFCGLERRSFEKTVSRLTDEFELDSVADRILVERAAMYLVRVVRAEAYEATVGLCEKSAVWGYYISRLDNTLRGLLRDLAVTRSKRMQMEKRDSLLVSVDDLLRKFTRVKVEAKGERQSGKRMRRLYVSESVSLFDEWRKETAEFRRRPIVDA